MGVTSIEWTSRSWNPIRGTKGRHICQRFSAGCKNCYAATINRRFSGIDYVAGADTPRLDERALTEPLRWRECERCFVCSMTDLFWEAIPDEFIDAVFAVMAQCPATKFQVLTKRPERMLAYLTAADVQDRVDDAGIARHGSNMDGRWPLPNIHLGVSVENEDALWRVGHLLQTPAVVRFLSVEPLLGPVDLRGTPLSGWCMEHDFDGGFCLGSQCRRNRLHWIIVGGESGPGARPCDVAWIRSVVAQAKAAGVATFCKQLGAVPMMREAEWAALSPSPLLSASNRDRVPAGHVPLKLSDPKGGDMNGWPAALADLHVREFPR